MSNKNKFLPVSKDKKVVILGFGISNISVAKYLSELGLDLLIWDDNENTRNKASSYGKIIHYDNYNFSQIAFILVSPGIIIYGDKAHPLVKQAMSYNIALLCDIELLYDIVDDNRFFIGITGTNGKSTTTALINHIFDNTEINHAMGGNIGVPAFDLPKVEKNGFYILETSSYQLDLLHNTQFDISVLLNITPDHIDHHGSMEKYIEAKKRIFAIKDNNKIHCNIINIDDPICYKIFNELDGMDYDNVANIPISLDSEAEGGFYIKDNIIYDDIMGESYPMPNLPNLIGEHNKQNMLAAFVACYMSAIKIEDIIKSITTFKGLKHRIEKVGEYHNIEFFNDSKATNAQSTEKAIISFENKEIYWIVGGVKKEEGIEPLVQYFSKIKKAYLVGTSTDEFANIMEQNHLSFSKDYELEKALSNAIKDSVDSQKEAVILFSPSCASFDQWKNFEERGEGFRELVGRFILKYS